jgi:nuclear transport factor 2 (NTF2) superfamily protein
MPAPYETIINKAYEAFNARDIDGVFTVLQPDVHWPNGWEGGYVEGYEQVRDYWTRQWAELNPHVEPIQFTELPDGRIETIVQQTVKDIEGNLLLDGPIKHVYTITDGLITTMEIVKM